MASIGWEKIGKRWRVFWHVTLQDGTVDKGSKSFKDKKVALAFKKHCEKREQTLKRTEIVDPVLLDKAVGHWVDSCQGYTDRTANLYVPEVNLANKDTDYRVKMSILKKSMHLPMN